MLIALERFPPVVFKGVTIQAPKLYHFFRDTNTQVIEDLHSSVDLNTYALKHPLTEDECDRIGCAIGRWLRQFHSWANWVAQEELRNRMKQNVKMRELKFQITYGGWLAETISRFPDLLEGCREILQAVTLTIRDGMIEKPGAINPWTFLVRKVSRSRQN